MLGSSAGPARGGQGDAAAGTVTELGDAGAAVLRTLQGMRSGEGGGCPEIGEPGAHHHVDFATRKPGFASKQMMSLMPTMST